MSDLRPSAVIVLAAGAGTRMKSRLAKVLHPLCGRSMVGHAIATASALHAHHIAVVVRHQRDAVAQEVTAACAAALIVDQDEQPGTGRAVECALEALPQDLQGPVVVTYGDVPLLSADLVQVLLEEHEAGKHAVTALTAHLDDPTGYGRLVRNHEGEVEGIVEHKDATHDQRAITEINSGIYVFEASSLRMHLANIGTHNAQGEKYLTDVLHHAVKGGEKVGAVVTEDIWQTMGANDRIQLAQMAGELNRRILHRHMAAGVTIIDPATTWIDSQATIGTDVVIRPGTQILGASRIGSGAEIGPDTTLTDVEVGEDATVIRCHGTLAVVGAGATVGPFAYLRPGTELGAGGKIGTFVETKNAQIGPGAKVPHLSYVGDATIGAGANIGAATVFVNYDGVNKYRTQVGAHARVGSDTMLVAPVTIGDGAYTAAGSVIDHDVPAGAIAVARSRQRNIEGWVTRRRAGTAAAEAAEAAAHQSDNEASAH